MPTELARSGNFSEYGVRLFDPATGQEFPNATIPADRISPQARNILALIPPPNAPGTDNGIRNNFNASGIEEFTENSMNMRIDGRVSPTINTFGRYSHGKFKRDGPSAFGAGGGPPFGSLGGVSNVRNQSLAYGLDYALSPSLLMDFRFGWFQYKVDVLPGDFGTTPAADAGIPGLNNDQTFSSGLPYFEIRGNQPDMDWGWSLNDNAGRCNCPLAQDEKQWQAVGNITKLWGNHTSKVGLDIRRAYNLRIPSDNHRSGQLSFNHERTGSPTLGGGLGLATFMLGDVTRLARYISATFEARERQWRHAYYAQDTWRVNQKLTLNYGLRLDVINPQTVNEPGNGTWVDLSTGQGLVGGIGDIDLAGNVENRLNWAPRLGATYQLNEKTVIRGGYGRSYDLGVFGSLFGHTVTQNLPVLANQVLNRPNQFASVFNLAAGPAGAEQRGSWTRTGRSRGRTASRHAWCRARCGRPRSMRGTSAPSGSSRHDVRRDWLCGQSRAARVRGEQSRRTRERGRDRWVRGGRTHICASPLLRRRRPPNVLGIGGAYGWTQDVLIYFNEAQNWYKSMQAKFTRRFSDGWSAQVNYTLQKVEGEQDEYWIYDPDLNKGPSDFDRTHNFTAAIIYELPFGRDKKYGAQWNGVTEAILGGWQVRDQPLHPQRHALRSELPGRQSRSRYRAESSRPDWRSRRPGNPRRVVQRDAHRLARQRLRPTGAGHLRQSAAPRPARPWLLAGRHVVLQELQAGHAAPRRGPSRSGEHLQPRQPG